MSLAINQPEKEVYTIVKLTYGNPSSLSYKAFTDWPTDIPANPTYVATPAMEIKIPANNGILDEKTLNLALPWDSWLEEVVNGLALAPMKISVAEITKPIEGGPQATFRYVFTGKLIRAIKNYQGRLDKAVLQFTTIKSRLDIPLGITANTHCVWTLFRSPCGANSASYNASVTIDDVDGKILTVKSDPNKTGKYFHRGVMERQGVRISIQDWDASSPLTFYLVKAPPTDWVEDVVLTAYAGCDRTLTTCITRFSQEINFGGIGYKMPSYNPMTQSPS